MNGDSIVADTSLIINFFNGNNEAVKSIKDHTIFLSVISEIEILSFPNISIPDKNLLKEFLSGCYIIELEPGIKEITIEIRSKYKVKLPDSIIAATAMYFDLPLYTMDKGFTRIADLNAVILPL